MIYKIKEYQFIFDAPQKRMNELFVVQTIMNLLNKGKYADLEDFLAKSSTYADFINNNRLDTVVKSFYNCFTESDYERLVARLKELTNKKSSLKIDNLKVSNFDDVKYVENSIFKMAASKENTDRILDTMKKDIKTNDGFISLYQVNQNDLIPEQKKMFDTAFRYQEDQNDLILINLEQGAIKTSNGKVIKIESLSDGAEFISDNDKSEDTLKVSHQKVLTSGIGFKEDQTEGE